MWLRWLAMSLVGVGVATGEIDAGGKETCPACPPGGSCSPRGGVRDECFYGVPRGALVLQAAGAYYRLRCPPGMALDDRGAPSLPRLRAVPRAVVERCGPPDRPYATALGALNVSVMDDLVLAGLPPGAALRDDHLVGLSGLRRLAITGGRGDAETEAALPLPPSLLSPLVGLSHLQLASVSPSPSALSSLPPSLLSLHLSRCSLRTLPPAALSRLPRLRHLLLDEPLLTWLPNLSSIPSLESVVISAPLPATPSLHSVINATLSGVKELRLSTGCGSLQRLYVMGAPLGELAGGWLLGGAGAPCTALVELWLTAMPSLSLVHPRALEGAQSLRSLTLSGCPLLTSLPAGLLLWSRNLQRLDLSRNGLRTLSHELLSPLTSLQWLDLSNNALGPATVGALGALGGLQVLRLGGNALGDLCPKGGERSSEHAVAPLSPLSPLTELRSLSLANTGATAVCADWRRLMTALTSLELQNNNITALTAGDLQWYWRRAGDVDLRGNPIEAIAMGRREHEELRPAEETAVRVRLERTMRCGCGQYWLARAIRDRRLVATLDGVTCTRSHGGGGDALQTVDLHDMVCEAKEQCAEGCSCEWRPHDDTLVAKCENATEVPRFPLVPAQRMELRLRLCCGVTRLELHEGRVTGAGAGLQLALDLRGDGLSDAAALLSPWPSDVTVSLLLQDNPLQCDCAEVTALHTHRNKIMDFENVTCSDGELVNELHPTRVCHSSRGVVGLVLGLLGLAGLMAGVTVGPLLRARVKAWLRHRRRKLGADTDYKYDGFLVFSRHDWETAERVMEETESPPGMDGAGEGALALCVHWRDWAAGEWVPSAIARSVSASRRTVAVVSDHFVRAVWARAELRQALARYDEGRAHRPVLLLPPGLQMPPALRLHARRCHVLHMEHRDVWPQLRRLLAGRRRPPPTAAPALPEVPALPAPADTAPCA